MRIPLSKSAVTTARTIHARHNGLGFRDIEYNPDGRPLILFVGNSFVWGVDAETSERFTDLLRERIEQFSILNAGVSGYGTDQELLWLKRVWPRVRPAIVVLLFCTDNDRLDNGTNVRYGGYRKPYFDTSSDGTLSLKGQPVPKSLKLLIREHWLPRHLWLWRLASLAYVEVNSPQVFVPDPTEKIVSAIDEFVASNGAKLLIALQRTDAQLISLLRARVPVRCSGWCSSVWRSLWLSFHPRGEPVCKSCAAGLHCAPNRQKMSLGGATLSPGQSALRPKHFRFWHLSGPTPMSDLTQTGDCTGGSSLGFNICLDSAARRLNPLPPCTKIFCRPP